VIADKPSQQFAKAIAGAAQAAHSVDRMAVPALAVDDDAPG
jgi:hypothetical protein